MPITAVQGDKTAFEWFDAEPNQRKRDVRQNERPRMMVSRRLIALFGAVFLTSAAPVAQAQSTRAPAAVQKSYDTFIVAFRAALKANDAAAVTELTQIPFHWNEMRDAAYFRENLYAKIFTRKARDCIARQKGQYGRDGLGKDNFMIICGEDIFVFTHTSAGFRFAEVGQND